MPGVSMSKLFAPRPTPRDAGTKTPDGSITEALDAVESWWYGQSDAVSAVASVEKEKSEVPQTPLTTKDDVFVGGLLSAGALSPGAAIALGIMLL